MAYDRGYRREHGRSRRSGRDVDYGWGVPIRGMYDYSLDYGGLSGPESEDSESIPPYESGRPDWTGPRPRFERHHWAAAEPAGEPRYREGARGRGGYAREFGPFRDALQAARARAQAGYASDFAGGPGRTRDRGGWPGASRRGASFGPGRDFGRGVPWRAAAQRPGGGYGAEYGRGPSPRGRGYADEYRGGRAGGYDPFYRSRGPRARWGPYGGRVAPGGD